MIMPRGQPLLMPVNPVFIVVSLTVGLALNMLPLGRVPWMPDVLMLLLAFWGVHQPSRVGIGVAFVLGLCMDVSQSALLGQHALAYSLVLFGVDYLRRRLLWFGVWVQALHVLPLLLLSQVLMVLVRLLAGAEFPGWAYFLSSFSSALLWMPLSLLLLLPQLQPVERDDNRPI